MQVSLLALTLADVKGLLQELSQQFVPSAVTDFNYSPAETKPVDFLSLGAQWANKVLDFCTVLRLTAFFAELSPD